MTGLQPDFVTIIARNYVPAARVLARSLARHHPASLLHVITVDADLAAEFATLDNVRTIAIDDIALPDLGVMALKYEILEFCTAIKPFALSYLLERLEGDALIYLDPDIQVLSPMFELLDALHSSSIVLTPHRRRRPGSSRRDRDSQNRDVQSRFPGAAGGCGKSRPAGVVERASVRSLP